MTDIPSLDSVWKLISKHFTFYWQINRHCQYFQNSQIIWAKICFHKYQNAKLDLFNLIWWECSLCSYFGDEPLVSIWTCCQDSITPMLSGAGGGNCELCDITAVNIYSEQTNRHTGKYRFWDEQSVIFHSHVNLIFSAGHQKLKASALYCSVMEKFEICKKSIQNITGERYLQILPFLTNDFLSSQR